MQSVFEFIKANIGYVIPALLVIYVLITTTVQAWDGLKSFSRFHRIRRVDKHGAVDGFFRRLMDTPPDLVSEVLSRILLPTNEDLYLEQLVREHTQILPRPTLVGIHDTPKGKVETRFYVDVLSACCDARTRRKLAQMIAIRVVNTMQQEKQSYDAIAVSARGNVLLAAEVGDLLDKPIVLIGDLAGVTFPERIQAMPKKPQKYIIVDGLSASGEEIIYVSNLIKSIGGETRFVFTVIDRCFFAKDRAKNESPFPYPIELKYIAEYGDRKCSQLLIETNHKSRKR